MKSGPMAAQVLEQSLTHTSKVIIDQRTERDRNGLRSREQEARS